VEGINSFSHPFVLESLEKVGISEWEVEFVNITVQKVKLELQHGKIVAAYIYEPFTDDAIKKGIKVLSSAADVPGLITTVLAFHSVIIEQRPSHIQNILL
jgi:NitT/TauT family transport system substrate-binding protein